MYYEQTLSEKYSSTLKGEVRKYYLVFKVFLFLIFFMYHFIAHVQYFYLPSDLTVLFIVNVQHHDDEHGSHKNQINKHLHPMH